MAATVNVFIKEVTAIFQKLYRANLSSRANFKEAFELAAVRKMPHATENERRKLVDWACRLYDHERSQWVN